MLSCHHSGHERKSTGLLGSQERDYAKRYLGGPSSPSSSAYIRQWALSMERALDVICFHLLISGAGETEAQPCLGISSHSHIFSDRSLELNGTLTVPQPLVSRSLAIEGAVVSQPEIKPSSNFKQYLSLFSKFRGFTHTRTCTHTSG